MKRFLQFALLASLLTLCGACDDDNTYEDPGLEVTPNNIAGIWELTQWSAGPLEEGTYLYIEFTRRDRTFTMYDNLQSFSADRKTGNYFIYTDETAGAIIRGQYDYGKGDWNHRYTVSLTATQMIWVATDDAENRQIFERRDAVPEEILSELGE